MRNLMHTRLVPGRGLAMVGHSFIGQQLVRRARLESIVQHLEFSREIVDQRSGRFRFPSGNVCLADRPECSTELVEQPGPGHR